MGQGLGTRHETKNLKNKKKEKKIELDFGNETEESKTNDRRTNKFYKV